MDNIQLLIEDLDEDFLINFNEEIVFELAEIEQYLMDFHLGRGGCYRSKKVLSVVQQLKSTCQQTFLDPLQAYVQVTEDLLLQVQQGMIPVCAVLSELLLLIFDEVRAASEDLVYRRSLDVVLLDDLRAKIKEFLVLSPQEMPDKLASMIPYFASRVHPDLVYRAFEGDAGFGSDVEVGQLGFIADSAAEKDNVVVDLTEFSGLEVFRDLAESADQRSEYWSDKTAHILATALLINENLPEGKGVNKAQLSAAVFMHDVFMSLLPDSILFKQGRYDSVEVMLLQQHPLQATQILKRMNGWEEAARIVHQHHERYDGEGYPNQMAGGEICMGAKIIAVADTFFSLTNKRSDREYKKSVLRALSEINKFNGRQFDPLVVEVFNQSLISVE